MLLLWVLGIPITTILLIYLSRHTLIGSFIKSIVFDLSLILCDVCIHAFCEKLAFKITGNYAINTDYIDLKFIRQYISKTATAFKLRSVSSVGRTSAMYKLEIEDEDPKAPKSIIIKGTTKSVKGKVESRIMKQAHEVYFYQRPLHYTADRLKTPKCYYSNTFLGTDTLLVMEDLSHCTILEPTQKSVSLDIFRMHLKQLASWQSVWWNHPDLSESWLTRLNSPKSMVTRQKLFTRCLPPYVKSFCEGAPDHIKSFLLKNGPTHLSTIHEHLNRNKPLTLLHGDYRMGNFLYTPDMKNCYALDWQFTCTGNPAVDLNFMLILDLSIQQRKKHENELLEYYHQNLDEIIRAQYPFVRLIRDYKLCTFYQALFSNAVLIFKMGLKDDPMIMEWNKRIVNAIQDHWEAIVSF